MSATQRAARITRFISDVTRKHTQHRACQSMQGEGRWVLAQSSGIPREPSADNLRDAGSPDRHSAGIGVGTCPSQGSQARSTRESEASRMTNPMFHGR